jgi:hypothetical protein
MVGGLGLFCPAYNWPRPLPYTIYKLATVMRLTTNLDSFIGHYTSQARNYVIQTAAYAIMLLLMLGTVNVQNM